MIHYITKLYKSLKTTLKRFRRVIRLSPPIPKYIIGCDFANGKDSQVIVGIIKKTGVIEYKIDRKDNFEKLIKENEKFWGFKD
tara:strand:- start:155 stop:403 length:249 start_codon:yes stop_codon:yes gene_type:complete